MKNGSAHYLISSPRVILQLLAAGLVLTSICVHAITGHMQVAEKIDALLIILTPFAALIASFVAAVTGRGTLIARLTDALSVVVYAVLFICPIALYHDGPSAAVVTHDFFPTPALRALLLATAVASLIFDVLQGVCKKTDK